ncbi:hypothetical protein MTsDn1_25230 [Alteromonas sp. MTD1]|uniref:hypothetical protein n=1 Tax=Alteromonas sp. MTD1 TaxID=3057962 RepID=UPI0036F1EE3C
MRTVLSIVGGLLFSFHCFAEQKIIVVANIALNDNLNQISLSKSQIREIFMTGSSASIAADMTLKPIALAPGNKSRVVFNTHVIGLPESRIQSYWAQMQFSGRYQPPMEVDDVSTMIERLKNTKGTIGYLPTTIPIPSGLVRVHPPF